MTAYAQATTVGDLLVRSADRWPDQPALIFPDHTSTYADLRAAATRVARGLRALGVRRGDRVGVYMRNCPEFVHVLFGAALLGAVVVPLNARYRRHELGYVIEHSDLSVLVLRPVPGDPTDCLEVVRAALPELADAPDPRRLALAAAPRLRAVVRLDPGEAPGTVSAARFVALAETESEESVARERAAVRIRDTAALPYTSGTTARPKGCRLSHEALTRKAAAAAERYRLRPGDRFWNPLPLFHLSAIGPLLSVLGCGGAYLSMPHFEPDQAWRMLTTHQVTHIYPTFPAVVQGLLHHPEYDPAALPRLRMASGSLPRDMFRWVQERLPAGATLVSTYGMTESAGLLSISELDAPLDRRAVTNGRPLPGVEVRIVDPDTGAVLPPGRRGLIEVTGYCLFDGYHRDPAATRAAFTPDGWFRTADVGQLDPDGRLAYLGRASEMLRVGGENVSPLEIEAFLATHPAVKLVQVVGRPDPTYGEVPVAFVEPVPGVDPDPAELIGYCRGQLASFKIPREVHLVDEWPMSATKIVKAELRRRLLAPTGGPAPAGAAPTGGGRAAGDAPSAPAAAVGPTGETGEP